MAETLRDKLEKLAPRERRLLAVFGAVLGVMLLLLVPLGVTTMLSGRRDENRELRAAIAAIKNGREAVRLRQAKKDQIAARYSSKAPALAGLIEKAARDQKLDVPESQDRPDVPHGKKYNERSTVVRLRKAGMLQLSKMLEAIEQLKMNVTISRLNVRRRGGEHDSYDVELGLSAYDREGAPPSGSQPSPASSGGGK